MAGQSEQMSLLDFTQYCKNVKPRCINFFTENQAKGSVPSNLKINCDFTNIAVFWDISAICVTSQTGLMFFQHVSDVSVDENATPLGTVVRFSSGDNEGERRPYELIMTTQGQS